jgi:hypothetical protein
MAALVGAWILGATAMNDGYVEVSYYRAGDSAELARQQGDAVSPSFDREALVQTLERYFIVKDIAKNRAFPLAVATLLLGLAMWLLAAGAMAGRNGARTALLQVILAHTAVIVLTLVITRDVCAAEAEASSRIAALTPVPAQAFQRAGRALYVEYSRYIPLVGRSLRLAAYALVLVALTRRRTREFFEAARADH